MARGKGGRGGRSGRNSGGHNGPKQRLLELDTDMADAPRPRNERRTQNRDNHVGFRTQHENNNRRRVGKASRARAQAPQSIFSDYPHSQKHQSARKTPFNPAFPASNPSGNIFRRNTRRASIVTCVSAFSTQAGARGPYCYKCAGTNRKLRQAMLDLLETTLTDGRKLIDEWAFEAGVSPDHMECERTKMRNLPISEGQQRGGEPCNNCKAELFSHIPGHNCTSLDSAQISPACDPVGHQLPFDSLHHQPLPQMQQNTSPYNSTRPDLFARRPDLAAAPQAHHLMSWTAPRNMPSIPEQEAAYNWSSDNASRTAQSQTRQYLYQQQRPAASSGLRAWLQSGNHPDAQTHYQSIQQREQPDDNWAEVIRKAGVLRHMQQQDLDSATQDPYEPQAAAQAPMPLTPPQQRPFFQQQLQQPLGHQSGSCYTNTLIPALGQEAEMTSETTAAQTASARTLISPPSSYEMTIPAMLNRTDEPQQHAQRLPSSVATDAGTETAVRFFEQELVVGATAAVDLNLVQMVPSTEAEQQGAQRYAGLRLARSAL